MFWWKRSLLYEGACHSWEFVGDMDREEYIERGVETGRQTDGRDRVSKSLRKGKRKRGRERQTDRQRQIGRHKQTYRDTENAN